MEQAVRLSHCGPERELYNDLLNHTHKFYYYLSGVKAVNTAGSKPNAHIASLRLASLNMLHNQGVSSFCKKDKSKRNNPQHWLIYFAIPILCFQSTKDTDVNA